MAKKVTVKEAKGKKTVMIELLPLQDGTFRHSVEAEVYGQLGIIPARFVEGQFVVVHMPTLMSFNRLIPPWLLKDKKKLTEWALKAQAKMKPEWDLMAKLKPGHNLADSHGLREKIRAHCLKVKL